ncbi:unnamed protein product, partial [Acanthoscelides obtectus]
SKLYIQGTTLRGPRVSDEDPVTQAQASEGPNVRHVFRVVAAAAGANGAESWICSGSGAPRRFSAWASFGRGGGGGGVPSSRQATLAPPPPKRPELPSEQQVAGAHTHSLTHSRIRPSATRSSQPVGSRQPPRRFRRTPQNTRTHSNSLTKDTHPCKSDYLKLFYRIVPSSGLECPTYRNFCNKSAQFQSVQTQRTRRSCHIYRDTATSRAQDFFSRLIIVEPSPSTRVTSLHHS